MSLLKNIVVDTGDVDPGAEGTDCVLAQSKALARIWYSLVK